MNSPATNLLAIEESNWFPYRETEDTEDSRVTQRLSIIPQDAHPIRPSRRSFLDLPGELRNAIYKLALSKNYQRVPLDRNYVDKREQYLGLLQTCSRVYHEARSYMVEEQTVYIPVMGGMDWTFGKPAAHYGLSRETKDTMVAALTDFASVHFHLHIDPLCEEDYDPVAVLKSLEQALKLYMANSYRLYTKNELKKRHAVVHLDHLLSLWPKLSATQGVNHVPIDFSRVFVETIAQDKFTDWEIRYYIGTGQASIPTRYGACLQPDCIRDTELVQLRFHANQHNHIKVFAEIYGDNTDWGFGDRVGCAVRHRTPVTEFWPNMHFDATHYAFETYNDAERKYPEHMPMESFDIEALDALHERKAQFTLH